MDSRRFDTLARSFHEAPSRRGLLRGLASAALGLAAFHLPDVVSARRRHKKKRKTCRNCGPCQRCRMGRCRSGATGSLCPGGYCQGGRCNPSFCAGQDHCVADAFCSQPGAAVSCNCFVTAGSGVPFCGQEGYSGDGDCELCEPGDACVRCGGSVHCQRPCANPL